MGLLGQAILQDQKATGMANTSSEALGAHLDGAEQAQAEFTVNTCPLPFTHILFVMFAAVDAYGNYQP